MTFSTASQPPCQSSSSFPSQPALPWASASHLDIDILDMDELDLAYRQTLYQVFSEAETIAVRVGIPNTTLDQLVRQHRYRQWALITAHNPYSQPLTAQENQARNELLVKDLWSLHLPICRAVGQDDAKQWPAEESFFVMGIWPKEAIALGQKYDQNAILVGKVGHAPQLVWIR